MSLLTKMNFWIVDTFAKELFQGIPSAVFFVENLYNDELLQNIAMEINTPETIFLKDLQNGDFESVCFTPKSKGLFFGNSLFAAAKVIYKKTRSKEFKIISGIRIFAVKITDSNQIQIRFSTVNLNKVTMPLNLDKALNDEIIVSLAECKDELIIEIRSPKRLINLNPNIDILSNIGYNSFVITTDTHFETNADYDFCAKVFAPKLGLYNSLISPIANTKLAAYWFNRMNKNQFVSAFVSENRNTYSHIEYDDEFTYITGDCLISTSGEFRD